MDAETEYSVLKKKITKDVQKGVSVKKHESWGFDVNSYEPVNLLKHIESGKTGFDDQWNVVSEHIIDALYKGGKNGGKKGSKKGEIVCF